MRTIRGLRVDQKISQEDICKEFNMTAPQYGGFEIMADNHLEKLAKVLGVRSIKLVIEE